MDLTLKFHIILIQEHVFQHAFQETHDIKKCNSQIHLKQVKIFQLINVQSIHSRYSSRMNKN